MNESGERRYVAVIRNKQGDVIRREPIASSTITRLLDEHGETPQPPKPAYLQELCGVPAGYFTADDIEEVSSTPTPTLNDATIERIAQRVVELLETRAQHRLPTSMTGLGDPRTRVL